MNEISPLQKARAAYAPKLPVALRKGAAVKVTEGEPTTAVADVEKIKAIFETTFGSPVLTFEAGEAKAMPAITA
ncbi:MAG: diphosphate--fructose-6-phosphate 1-phosphotransferase, partial [Lentisphaeria bacterium]|nr:diphosphate--fructose-6-phosphate 1-phosphotransferase [Lentisphaeria bacterium]